MAETISVVVVDDHPLYRAGVVRSLQESPGFEVLAEGASADDALAICERHAPDVVVLDISMPGSGLAAAAQIAQRWPSMRIVMLTASEQHDDIMQALAVGASGYVVKGVGADEFVTALRGIARGEPYVSPTLAARLLAALKVPASVAETSPFDMLSAREEQILRLVAQGLSNKEVALRLRLQEKTIKHYMTTILQKLQARNRVEAALMANDHWARAGR